jgi:hypothetical protein
MDYPSDADLDFIKNYSLKKLGPIPLIDHIAGLWHWQDYFKWEYGKLELHTGGWSGNEDIIEALMPTEFWLFYWIKSERGGHFYFEIPEKESD